MPLNIFKQPQERADDAFREAYEKGVSLGPQKWSNAVYQFSEASKYYATVGNHQKSGEAYALATLFYALTTQTDQSWRACSEAMNKIPDTQLNIGFPARSTNLAQQASVISYDIATTRALDGESRDISRVEAVRDLAKKYLDLDSNDLALWKLQHQEIDPHRHAYYLLGLASLILANNLAHSDPGKSASLLSEAATNLELAGKDPLQIGPGTRAKLDNMGKFGRCWFCGRDMQGHTYHFVLLPAAISDYTRQRYGSTTPASLQDNMVVACGTCASSIRNVADKVARAYYESAVAQMRALEQRIDERITRLENLVNSFRAR